jgi:hypothetical protein
MARLGREQIQRAVCIVVAAAFVAGCGGDSSDSVRNRDTRGLPKDVRDTIACLRDADITVRVPEATRRVFRPHSGAQEGQVFLTFYTLDKNQNLTQEQDRALQACEDRGEP